MNYYFATSFEDVRHERLLLFLLSLADTDFLKQIKSTDHELNLKKYLALE